MPVNILYTGSVAPHFVSKNNELHFDFMPFVALHLNEDTELTNYINNLIEEEVLVILTSQYAVAYLKKNVQTKPKWKIACLQGATFEQIEKMGWADLVSYTAVYAAELGTFIAASEKAQACYFLTNNKRTDALPDIIKNKGFQLIEYNVYTNEAIHQSIEKKYQGIVFLSPSAVDSFFNNNTLDENTALFSIGTSTAAAIAKYTKQQVIIAATPTQQSILESVEQYFD